METCKVSHEFNRKIRWQCRRGMLELDLVLSAFFDKSFASLDEIERDAFVELLEYPDPTLYEWFLGQDLQNNQSDEFNQNGKVMNPNPKFQKLIHSMRAMTTWNRSNLY